MDTIRDIIAAADPSRIEHDLYFLASDPLPCRTLNRTLPGREQSTLHEADDFITGILASSGFEISTKVVPVQAFVPDSTVAWGFRKPHPEDPWYDAVNVFGFRAGRSRPSELIVLLAHKDSQSWIVDGPGAYDNATGVIALLEISRLLANHTPERSLMFLFCNEEHWPWTSVDAAQDLAASPFETVAVLNVDSIGGKSESDSGRLKSVTRFSTPEGEKLADLIAAVNDRYALELEQTKVFTSPPNDDDGSFVNAGILPAVLLIGSYPYRDANYHTAADTPDRVDIENVSRVVQLITATVLTLCDSGS